MAVLDSSAIIHLIEGTLIGKRIKKEFPEEVIATTTISMNEVLIGYSEKERNLITPFFDSLEVLAFDKKSASASLLIEDSLNQKGKPLSKPDLFIAGICLANNLPIITADSDFIRVDGLRVILLK